MNFLFLIDLLKSIWFYHRDTVNGVWLIYAVWLIKTVGDNEYALLSAGLVVVIVLFFWASYIYRTKFTKQYKTTSPEFVSLIQSIEKRKKIIWLALNALMLIALLSVIF